MHRAAWGVLVVCLLAAGCSEQSRVAPEAAIRIAGTVRAPDGAPLSDRPVKLGAGVSPGDGTFAFLTLGLACAAGTCTGPVFDTTTDPSGSYVFELKGRDTQSTFGEAVSELVSVSAAPADHQVSGASISARFKVQTEQVQLPVLDLVDPGLTVEADAAVVAQWSTPKAGPYTLTFEAASPVPVWQVSTADSSVAIDPRALEDTAGRVVVAGSFSDAIEGSDLSIGWRSPGAAYASAVGAPPSRRRPCRYTDSSGTVAAEVACGLTDGDLTSSATTPSLCPSQTTAGTSVPPPCPPPAWVAIDLGQSVPGELVAVRGCDGGCAVEVSGDGVNFRPAGSAAEGFGLVPLDASPITAVRVGVGGSSSLREVSVWGPPPRTPPLRQLDEAGSKDLRAPFGTGAGADRDVPIVLVVLGVVLAAGVLVGAGYVAGGMRRRRVRV